MTKVLTCPYCEIEKQNEAGLSMHIKYMHPDKWIGTLQESISNGTLPNTTQPKSKRLVKGSKKPKIYGKCPWCSYKSTHPPGLAKHIQFSHPNKWKGNLGSSLGREPSREWKHLKNDWRHTKKGMKSKQRSNQKRRDRFLRMGLTTSGKVRKLPIRSEIAAKYGLTPTAVRTTRKIKPIVYSNPDLDKPSESTMDKIIDRAADKLVARLLE